MRLSKSFNVHDPFFLDDQLDKKESAIRDKAKAFANDHLAADVNQVFEQQSFDRNLIKAMGQAGFFGVDIETKYGGPAMNLVSYGLVAREFERIDSGYRTFLSVMGSLVMRAIYLFGTDDQKQHYLPRLAKGEVVAGFALSEPLHGSDPAGLETTAKKTSTGYVLNGHKRWIGLAPYADLLVIWAKDDDGVIRGFLCETGIPGLETPVMTGKWSLRTAPSGEVIMQDVKLPKEALLPHSKGLTSPLQCLDSARYGITWGALGAAESCFETALAYALERQQFDKPIAANQLVQQKLVDMHTEIALGLQACLQLGRCIDAGKGSPEMISMLKRNSVGKALIIARTARDILGGNGILDDYPIIRHMLNLESVNTYEGTYDIHTLILGRAITGIQSFT